MTLKDLLKKLKRIEFRTKARSQEAIAGTYHSAFKGRGMLFSECKPYEEGDDIRYIDWNASARQQGIFVKQFIEERELSVCIILDLSAPMRFGSVGMTKAETAIEAMSILAFSALQNNDKVGLFIFNEVGMKYIPQIKGKNNIVRLIVEALKFRPEPGASHLPEIIAKAISLMKRRSLFFIISDFLKPDYQTTLKHLAYRHEVIPIVVSDPMEFCMPDLGLTLLEDASTHAIILADTSSKTYREFHHSEAQARLKEQKAIFEKSKLSFVRISTVEDILQPITQAFVRRSGHV